ncbi:NAD(P)-dependent dehydrogenase (short-subunit alcohol dehydrogenase family) [Streptomyces griseochromogenes]|uniref:NAD(P)-dependent dehydrogenase (Short-subunit alcohol dehydrogenase family) n=2 Tax=Streptomyces griseochromogenes TaxID=68214 RepID=A0ABS4LJ40_9ACTN|nr:NAD(P)-dependent dehydrogenase (short-subunit alcohol dehydrogenase family) [Streptomyces griseochromogenes]
MAHIEETPTMTTAQQPLHSGFGAASTAEDVIKGIDLTGKVAIVTGGYSGIGLETSRILRAAGAEVVVPARDPERARAALKETDGVAVEPMDLIDPASVDALAERFLASGRPLHILVNSAGIMATPPTRDARGYEAQFATNHLGHFRLVARLWPALVAAHGARVVSVSSRGIRFSPVVFEDLHFEHRAYDPFLAYGQSKTANALFAVELDRRGRAEGVRAFAVHPGQIIDTGLAKHLSEEALRAAGVLDEEGRPVRDPARQQKTVPQGAATGVWCATNPRLDGLGGVYCENCDISPVVTAGNEAEWRARPGLPGVLPYAVDPEAAARLWEVSERLTA